MSDFDTCIFGGTIYQSAALNDTSTVLLIKDGVIVDANASMTKCPTAAKAASGSQIDLKGGYAYPGFTDAHAHLYGIGMREMTLNLENTASILELKAQTGKALLGMKKGETLYGRGWIETHWPEKRFPTAADLDEVSPNNPVILERADGHAVVANSAALRAAHINKTTASPAGGEILHDKNGDPSGMLIDNAGNLVLGLIQKPSRSQKENAYKKASQVYAAYGWTGLHNMSANPHDISHLEHLSQSGDMAIRVYNAIDLNGADAVLKSIDAHGPKVNKNKQITTRAIKVYADGALGSRGAALLAPYSDRPDTSGLMMTDEASMMPILEHALRNGIQVSTHAIGDKANHLVLDWYEKAFANIPKTLRKVAEPRWRIEHAQVLAQEDIPRFANLGVIASMQPSHAIGDLHFAVDRLGVERLKGAYAWRSLLDSGAMIAAGSDAPVERGDPRIEFYAAIARKDLDGYSGDGWYPTEKVSRLEALKMLTEAPAYAAFSEGTLGKLHNGYRADITVFDKDILTIPEAEIPKVAVLYTIVDGKIIYQKN